MPRCEPKKALSREFLAILRSFEIYSRAGLDELTFSADEEAESFEIVWNQEVFEEGKVGLEESTLSLSKILGEKNAWLRIA